MKIPPVLLREIRPRSPFGLLAPLVVLAALAVVRGRYAYALAVVGIGGLVTIGGIVIGNIIFDRRAGNPDVREADINNQ